MKVSNRRAFLASCCHDNLASIRDWESSLVFWGNYNGADVVANNGIIQAKRCIKFQILCYGKWRARLSELMLTEAFDAT